MKQIQYMQGNNDLPFEHQMLFILRNYQGLQNKLVKCHRERDEYKKKYLDVEPMVLAIRDANGKILALNKEIIKKQGELEQLNQCLKAKNEKIGAMTKRLKELEKEVEKRENQYLRLIETLNSQAPSSYLL